MTLLRNSRLRITALFGGGMLIFLIGVVWFGFSQASHPNLQQRVTLPAISGTEEYLVNLWTDPAPVAVGGAELTIQLSSTIGTPVEPHGLALRLVRPDGTMTDEIPLSPVPDGSGPEQSRVATVNFDQAGDWRVVARVALGGVARDVTFDITVQT